jgi:phage terminase large subunit-like protein
MTPEYLAELLQEQNNRKKYNYIDTIFPDTGECRRELYKKHIEFLNASTMHQERVFMAGNRTGKTLTGLYELCCHALGRYPHWWQGKKFDSPVLCYLCGSTNDAIRESMQRALMGSEPGTGLIPKDSLISTSPMQGTPNGIGTYKIKRDDGKGISEIITKTYMAGKHAVEGSSVDVVMMDEKVPLDFYIECQMRTMTTKGTCYVTFTPDDGLTDTVLHFFERDETNTNKRLVIMVGWDDVPHLSEEQKKDYLKLLPPHMVEVKTKGIPYLGKGAIYPVSLKDVACKSFAIPRFWPRAFGLDAGQATAAVWVAQDPTTGTFYVYDEYKRNDSVTPTSVHADAIKLRGKWIEGVIDKAAGNLTRTDCSKIIDIYRSKNVEVIPSWESKNVESGILNILNKLVTGQIRVFNKCTEFMHEYGIYHRNDRGDVVKQHDHLLDAFRYVIDSFDLVAKVEPMDPDEPPQQQTQNTRGISSVGGY